MPRRTRIVSGLVALALASGCQVAGLPTTPGKTPKPGPRTSAEPSRGPPASPAASAGVARPSPGAYFGRVLRPDGQPAADILVRGFLISDQGTGLIANNGGGVIANNGGGLITDNGGGLVANNGGGYRLAQASPLATRTAADGTFELKDPQGRPLNLEAVASDDLKAFEPAVAATAGGLDLTLAPTGTLTGEVKAEGVTDLIGVDVFVPGTAYVAKTDAAGRYTIPGVPAGTFELYATKPGLGKARASQVAVASKTTTTVPPLVLVAARPQIEAIEPAAAGPGAEVVLKGRDFAAAAGDVFEVTLAGAVIAKPTRVDGSTIRLTLPEGAKSGEFVVSVDGLQGNARPFQVLAKLDAPVLVRDLSVGETLAVRPFGLDTADKRVDAPRVAWTTDGPAATVDAQGRVTAAAGGKAGVTGASGATKLLLAFTVHAATDLVTTLAGGTVAGNADGAGGQAAMRAPTGLAFMDPQTLMFVDYGNHNVRRIDLTDPTLPVITTVAGGPGAEPGRPWDATPAIDGFADGPAREARFAWAYGGAPDGQGGYLVADQGNHRIRRVAADGAVTTVAGTGAKGAAEGAAAAATFDQPTALAVGPDGTIYVTEDNSKAVRMIKAGVVTTLAGAATLAGDADGPGATARFRDPSGLVLDGRGGLLVAESRWHRIRRIDLVDPAHPVTTFVGSTEGLQDGQGAAAKFADVGPMALAPDGTLYVADLQGWDDGYSTRLRTVSPEGVVKTIWGSTEGTAGRLDGPLAQAKFSQVGAMAVSPDGAYLYLADSGRSTDGAFLRRLRLK